MSLLESLFDKRIPQRSCFSLQFAKFRNTSFEEHLRMTAFSTSKGQKILTGLYKIHKITAVSLDLMRAIAVAHTSTRTTSLMRVKHQI